MKDFTKINAAEFNAMFDRVRKDAINRQKAQQKQDAAAAFNAFFGEFFSKEENAKIQRSLRSRF